MSEEKTTPVENTEVKIALPDNFKEMLDEGIAKGVENALAAQKKFRLTPSEENEQKAEATKKALNKVKFINDAAFNDGRDYAAKVSADRAKALNEGTGSAGGFLVPEEFDRGIYDAFDDYSQLIQIADMKVMRSDVMRLNELVGKVQVFKTAELATITASQPTFGEPVLTAEKYGGSVTLSEELIEDSELDIIANIERQFGERLAFQLQTSLLTSAVSGSEGLLTASGVTTVDQIAVTAGQISFDDLANMQAALFNEYNEMESQRGTFIMNMDAYNTLRKSKSSGDGNYFLPPVPSASAPATAWGRPIVLVGQITTPTATGSKYVIYSELNKHLVVGRRRALRMKVNTSGTASDGTELNYQDARELVITARFAQVTVNEAGIVCLVS